MAQWSNYVVYDVLGDICYGQSFDTLLREDNRFAVKLVGLSSKFHYLMGQMPVLKKLGLDRVLFKDLRANRQRFMAYSRSRLAERMTLGTDNDRRDFFYYLLKAKDPETGVGFQTQELWGESNVLLIAGMHTPSLLEHSIFEPDLDPNTLPGSDTTSTALASTLYYLLHNSSTLTTLTSEIRAAFSTLESIVLGPSLTACRYLRACIDESMRLSPPVPAILPREILPGGMHIAGQLFPAGTVVGVSAYTLHHNPAYYPAPFAFRPERWLGSAGSETNDGTLEINEGGVEKAAETALAQSAFCPFSLGARGCIGKGVAYLELGIALARLLWLYDLRLTPGYEGVGSGPEGNYALKDIFVGLKDGPIVEFRGRK
jgi:cytochrome P450